MASSICIRCGKPGTNRCSRCKQVNYCSAECQKLHWAAGHKGQCKVLAEKKQQEYIQTASPPAGSQKKPNGTLSKSRDTTPSSVNKGRSSILGVPTSDFLFPEVRTQKLATYYEKDIHGSVGGGLYNIGNTCFLNSVLQCFTYTAPLTTFLKTSDHTKQCKLTRGERPEFCMVCALANHVNEALYRSSNEPFFPREIVLNMRRLGDFQLYRQEDAHDFSHGILNGMQNALLRNLSDEEKQRLSKIGSKLEETTLVYQLFGGYIQSQLKCLRCTSVRSSYEAFLDLSLELSSRSLEEALLSFTRVEGLDESTGYRCETCGVVVPAEKQLTIFFPPRILAIQLKRFDIMRGGGKINASVAYRETLDISNVLSRDVAAALKSARVEYDLYAVVVHFGATMFGGHYVAFIKIDNTWWLFDDDKVFEVDSAIVLKQNAYLLFYRLRNPSMVDELMSTVAPSIVATVNELNTSAGKKTKKKGTAAPSHGSEPATSPVQSSPPASDGVSLSTISAASTAPGSTSQPPATSPSTTTAEPTSVATKDETTAPPAESRGTPATIPADSTAAPSTKPTVPKYQIFYQEEGLSVTTLVAQVELPQLQTLEHCQLWVTTTGNVHFASSPATIPHYALDLNLPFVLDSTEADAQYFELQKALVIRMPVLASDLTEVDEVYSVRKDVPIMLRRNGKFDPAEEHLQLVNDDQSANVTEGVERPASTYTPPATSPTTASAPAKSYAPAFSSHYVPSTDNIEQNTYRQLYRDIQQRYEQRGKQMGSVGGVLQGGFGSSSTGGMTKEQLLLGHHTTIRRKEEDRVGRNDICPCGSGKKFKKCHGAK